MMSKVLQDLLFIGYGRQLPPAKNHRKWDRFTLPIYNGSCFNYAFCEQLGAPCAWCQAVRMVCQVADPSRRAMRGLLRWGSLAPLVFQPRVLYIPHIDIKSLASTFGFFFFFKPPNSLTFHFLPYPSSFYTTPTPKHSTSSHFIPISPNFCTSTS